MKRLFLVPLISLLSLSLLSACIDETSPSFQVKDGSGSLTIEDQELQEPDLFTVASASAEYDAFIVVFDDADGEPGDEIGILSIEPGDRTNLEFTLDRDIDGEEPLHAALYLDPEPGEDFERDDGLIARTDAGDRARTEFTLTYIDPETCPDGCEAGEYCDAGQCLLRPTISTSDQMADPTDEILVDEVLSQ